MSIEVFDHEVVPASLGTIAPILRVAAEIEHERPRVAYLCMILRFTCSFASRIESNVLRFMLLT